ADPAARPRRRSDAEQFFQQLRDAAEAVEIDALPRRSDRYPPASEPGAQRRGAQGFRVEHVHEPERLQALGADELLPSGLYAGHDERGLVERDRKSTRLNSSHVAISYAVFCLKKKTKN